MTETEAKAKWCPITGLAGAIIAASLRSSDVVTASKMCIGSRCMMWRSIKIDLNMQANILSLNISTQEAEDRLHSIKEGFCGLAGKL